ncbi:hypothetical protein [Streptomyces prunicolor]
MAILLGGRFAGPSGEVVEHQLLDRAAVLLGDCGELCDEVIEGELRDLLDARIGGRLGGRLIRKAGRAARNDGGRRLGRVASSLRHDGLVDVPGDSGVAVAEGLGHDLDVDAGGEHERGGDVP